MEVSAGRISYRIRVSSSAAVFMASRADLTTDFAGCQEKEFLLSFLQDAPNLGERRWHGTCLRLKAYAQLSGFYGRKGGEVRFRGTRFTRWIRNSWLQRNGISRSGAKPSKLLGSIY